MSGVFKHVKHCSTHPKFLHSNSTSHRWAFGAIAELIDNAIDPDVNASQFCIDLKEFNNEPCLVLMDNGCGLNPERLHKMLSFGHSKKQLNPGDRSIGKHGNGFKSGTMRLGRDVLVLTKCAVSMTAGFLSQTFLAAVQAEDILIPLVTWDLEGNRMTPKHADIEESLQAICSYSIFPDEPSILAQLDAIPGTGTILIISNLRRHEGVLEMDYKTDPHDIRITSEITSSHYQQLRPNQPHSTDVPSDYSLRAYVSILYKVPRMQIFIRDNKVKTKRISGILSQKVLETYRPMGAAEPVKIEMGFNTENRNLYGMMLYHRNRLIKPYMRVGMQLEENERGMGVLGIVEADFLHPTHNKQDFDDTTAYRRLLKKLADVLAEYWWEKKERVVTLSLPAPETAPVKRITEKEHVEEDVPDVVWVQCDNPSCLKWRILPEGTDPTTLPDSWFCEYHPDPRYRNHEEAEQEWDMSVHHEIVETRRERKREYDRERKEKEANKRRQRLEANGNKEEQSMIQRQREAIMKELEEQRAKDALVLEQERKAREEAVLKLQKELEEVQAKRDEIQEQHNSLLRRMESDSLKKDASKTPKDVQFSEHEMSQVGVSGSEDLSEERPVESKKNNEEASSTQQKDAPRQWKDATDGSNKADNATNSTNSKRYPQQEPQFLAHRLPDASPTAFPSIQASYLSLQSNNVYHDEARRDFGQPETTRTGDGVRQFEQNFPDRRTGPELGYSDAPRVLPQQGAQFNVEENRRLQVIQGPAVILEQRAPLHGVQDVPEFTSRFQQHPPKQQLPGNTLGPLSSFQNAAEGSRGVFQDGPGSITRSEHPVHYSLSGVAGSATLRLPEHPSSLSLRPDSMVVARPDSSISAESSLQGRFRMAVQTLLRLSEVQPEVDDMTLSDLEVLTICEKAKAVVGMRWQAYEQEIAKLKAELAFFYDGRQTKQY